MGESSVPMVVVIVRVASSIFSNLILPLLVANILYFAAWITDSFISDKS